MSQCLMMPSCLLVLLLAAFININQARSHTREILLERDSIDVELVTVGESLRVRVRINAALPPTAVTWYKNGNELRSGPSRIKVTKEWLRIKAVKRSDSGQYACRIVMPDGREEWRNITLAVARTHDDYLQHEEGFSARGGNTKNLVFDPMSNSRVRHVDVDRAPLPAMSLKVDTSNLAYAVVTEMEVPKAPVFIRPGKMYRFIAKPTGNILRLRCPAEGNPSPNITWFKNDAIPERHMGTVHYGRWSLFLEDLETTDAGNYTCIVCNGYGCTNFTFTVVILHRFPQKPYITDGYPHNVTALVNSTATFHCPVISDLESYVQWLRVANAPSGVINDEMDISNSSKIQQAGDDCTMENRDYGKDCKSPHVLELYNVTYEDEGWYTCTASNALGIDHASAYLKVV